ncbi:MAG: choice-of-anchor Q domain-containing protein, partial [Paludibacteraceae bacterium]
PFSYIVIDNCSFINNKANSSQYGSALESDFNVNLNVTNCTFSNNNDGQAVFLDEGVFQFTNCIFDSNTGDCSNGSAIFALSSSLSISYCSFTNNWGQANGVMDNFSSVTTIDHCTFRGNYANKPGSNVGVFGDLGATGGGAIYNTVNGTLSVSNSVFENNNVWGLGYDYASGGAILNLNSDLSVENCLFRGNFSDGKGGAISSCYINNSIYSSHYPHANIINSCFTGNEGGINGGAVSIENNTSNAEITNCTISGNYVVEYPIGPGGNPYKGLGGGLSFSGTHQLIKNTIVWGDSAQDGADEIYYTTITDSIPVFYYSDIKGSNGSGALWNTAYGTDGGGNKDTDPAFISSVLPDSAPTTSGNVRFLHSSPAANAGNNSYVTLANDLDGNTRIQDGTVDMGAYESSSAYAPILYVNASAQYGSNEGTSWSNAYTSLQTALNAAVNGDQIWVAKGTYKPSYAYGLGGGSRYYHFEMKNGVSIYGGFAGTEDSVKQRTNFGPGGADETKLSGDLNGDDIVTGSGATLSITNNSENCYHVIYNPSSLSLTSSAVLNGFTIQGGFAN